LNKCVDCLRHTVRKPTIEPALLPAGRVNTHKVFEVTGCDLAGPVFFKDGGKGWIVLFTCAVYRCVHLELVKSLSTDAFLDAFSQFTSRRGRPAVIYSDNGTNFVGADNALKQLDWEKIAKIHAMEKMEWRFNPPAAPWWGGFWERLIRSVKDLLKRSLKRTKMSEDKLRTCLVEVEATINGRPLTVVNEDPDDLTPLTPAMFLHELRYPAVSDRELLESSGFRKLLANKRIALEQIKIRFRKEYLALLINREKSRKNRVFQIGDVVLVGSDDKKRLNWPMARIEELFKGKDGHVRVARVRTADGMLTRPIQWLFSMEISSPKDVPVQPVQEVETSVSTNSKKQQEALEVRTRHGRLVKVPARYSQ